MATRRLQRTSRRRVVADRLARWVVSAGGIAIIASVLGILIFIVMEVLPLAGGAEVGPIRQVAVPGAGRIGAVLADEHHSHLATLDDRGTVRIVRVDDGKVAYETDLLAAATARLLAAGVPPGSRDLVAATSDGRVIVKSMEFAVTFDAQQRVVAPDTTPAVALELDPQHRP